MELYCLVGGQTDSLKRWEADLNAQFFPTYTDGKHTILGKNEKGQDIVEHRRLLVAPIQLYKICFAKEELENVLPLIAPSKYITERYPVLRRGMKFIKRMLKLKDVPEPKYLHSLMQPNQVDKAVFVMPIGLKDDAMLNGKEMI